MLFVFIKAIACLFCPVIKYKEMESMTGERRSDEMEEKNFRNKINWFTFCFSILVIWVHSYNAFLFLGKTAQAVSLDHLERFLGGRIAQIAVPGFFLISSYLFFRGYSPQVLKRKWTARIKSVLVPYIIWNSLYYLGYVIGSRLPVISGLIGKGRIPFSLTMAVDAIINYTYNYVFWYLFQLILLILLAPFLYLTVKRVWSGILFLVILMTAIYFGKSLPWLNLDALFYYSFAAFAAVHGKTIAEEKWTKKRFAIGVLLFVAGCAIDNINLPGDGIGEVAVTTVMLRLMVPVSLWFMVSEEKLFMAAEFMRNNFFLYAVHFALVRLINKTGASLLPPVPALAFIFFFLMPVFAVVISQLAGCLLKRCAPVVWELLNGGR